jgi:CelD/BcsL family acetyltransferase involved in cellulose biosynthesis
MQIELVTSTQAFDALEADWRALEARSARGSVFLSWDWQRLWWTHYGCGRQLRILIARADNAVVGLFPLYLEHHRVARILRVRKLRPIGAGGDTSPDDLGILAEPSCEQAVAQAFVHHILTSPERWHLLDLVDLPSDSALVDCLARQAAQQPALIHREPPNRITYGDLPANWDSYRQSLSRNRREVLGRKRRRFEQQPGARFEQIVDAAQLDPAFERLAELHRRRWQGRTDELGFTSTQYLGFHRDVMRALLERNSLLLYALEMNGDIIAMFYGFRHAQTCYYFQAGFDPQHAALSPGEVLMGYVIEAAIGAGCTRFDMLKGDYGHKRHFFQQTRQTVNIRVHRPGLIHLLYRIKQWRLERQPQPRQQQPEDTAVLDAPPVAEQRA